MVKPSPTPVISPYSRRVTNEVQPGGLGKTWVATRGSSRFCSGFDGAPANPSPPSGWARDFPLQDVEHARHKRRGRRTRRRPLLFALCYDHLVREMDLKFGYAELTRRSSPRRRLSSCRRSQARLRNPGAGTKSKSASLAKPR
jgi:hypothetical protein